MSEEAKEIVMVDLSTTGTDPGSSEQASMESSEGNVVSISEVIQEQSNEEQPAKTKRQRHRFTPYEDRVILRAQGTKRGRRKQELKRIAETLNMSQTSVERRFYFLVRRQKQRQRVVPPGERERVREKAASAPAQADSVRADLPGADEARPEQAEFFKTNDKFMEELLSLPQRVEALEKRVRGMLDLKGFVERLVEIDRRFDREQELLEELAKKEREIQHLKEDMQNKIERMNRREEELNELYQLLDVTLQQFMGLSSLDKLRVLGDFTVKVETVIDKFGNIIRRRPIVVP